MNKRIIRVLWADDEEVYNEDYMPWESDQYKIELVAGVQDADELRSELIKHFRLIDAVIIDANFADKGMPTSERTGSGLVKSNELRAKYENWNKAIPFFLFTGRSDDVLKDMFVSDSGMLDYFVGNNHKFSKLVENATQRLFDRIDEVVEQPRTPEYQIRNKYQAEFEAAKLIEDAERNLEIGLLFVYEDGSWKDAQDYFNPARKIVERIIDSCVSMNLLPPHISLNTAQKILNGGLSDYSLSVPLMEKPLAESLRFFLNITQDGSHDVNDLKLGVDQYVRKTQNVNLYLSILHIAMDLLLWHDRMHKTYGNNINRLWTCSFVYQGIVSQDPAGKFFYTGNYQLDNKNGLLHAGDLVGIRSSVPNKHATPGSPITDYVFETNYVIL